MNENWFKDAIVYHIFIDRFAGFYENKDDSKPEWVGGNLKVITKKLNYLKRLGINCIWLSPFYKSSNYHGYSVEDFYEIDEHFGNKKDLKELVKKAHENEIRVITDFIPNHCSSKHPFFIDAISNKNSKYRDWFYFKNWPYDYLSFLDFKNLPKINLDNKDARRYIIDAALYWIKEFDLDGFRLDHVIGPSIDFWIEFSSAIKKTKPDAVLIGEVWFFGINENHIETLKLKNIETILEKRKKGERPEDFAMQKFIGILDGCLDFTVNDMIRSFMANDDIRNSEEFFKELKHHYSIFSDFLLPTFLDNHDMDRFLFEIKDKDKLKLASVLQFSLSQPPIIYYGTEVGLSQAMSISEFENNGDVQTRRMMIWDEEQQDKDILKHYNRLCFLRKKIKSLVYGKMRVVYTDYKSGLLSFIKESSHDKVLVILNPDKADVYLKLDLKQFNINARYLIDLFLDEKIQLEDSVLVKKLEARNFLLCLIK